MCGAHTLAAWNLKSLCCACWRLRRQACPLFNSAHSHPAGCQEPAAHTHTACCNGDSHRCPVCQEVASVAGGRAAGPLWPRCADFPPHTGCQGFNVKTFNVGLLAQMLFSCREFDRGTAGAPGDDLCLSGRMQSQGIPGTELWKVPERSVYLSGAVGAYLWGRHGQPQPQQHDPVRSRRKEEPEPAPRARDPMKRHSHAPRQGCRRSTSLQPVSSIPAQSLWERFANKERKKRKLIHIREEEVSPLQS